MYTALAMFPCLVQMIVITHRIKNADATCFAEINNLAKLYIIRLAQYPLFALIINSIFDFVTIEE